MKKLVGQIILWHRYLGIVFCLFFATWFASGIVMLYARMPELTEADRLAQLRPIDPASLKLSAAQAFQKTAVTGAPQRVTVSLVGQRPAYHFLPPSGRWVTVFADDGSLLHGVDGESSVQLARDFARSPAEEMRWAGEPLSSGLVSKRSAIHIIRHETAGQWSVRRALGMSPARA
jgi:hypothetical protein